MSYGCLLSLKTSKYGPPLSLKQFSTSSEITPNRFLFYVIIHPTQHHANLNLLYATKLDPILPGLLENTSPLHHRRGRNTNPLKSLSELIPTGLLISIEHNESSMTIPSI